MEGDRLSNSLSAVPKVVPEITSSFRSPMCFFFLLGGLVRNRDEGEPSRMSSRQNYCVDAAVLPWWPAVVSEVAFVCRIRCSCVLLCSEIRIFEIASVGKLVFNHFSCGITFLTCSHRSVAVRTPLEGHIECLFFGSFVLWSPEGSRGSF